MKITASYLKSKYDLEETLNRLAQTDVDAIHLDLMDGTYIPITNFDIKKLPYLFKDINKPLDVHLMLDNPHRYVDTLYEMNTNIIFFHPKRAMDAINLIEDIREHYKKAGIVINPDEDIKDYKEYLDYVDAVLIMSVMPGHGGQKFMRKALINYEFIKMEKRGRFYDIYVDGGINEETITFVSQADGIISGSYICEADDFQQQIDNLRAKVNS